MASGHVNRTNRPNTWLHRPACKREEKPCQLGAVHTWHKADILAASIDVRFRGQRWGNRPAFLWIAERFGVLCFRLMVKRGPHMRPQASEGEAQHGLFCWTRRVGQGDERLHCG